MTKKQKNKEVSSGMLFCEDVELMLQDYLDGYLLPSQSEILESHVRGCASCRRLVGGLTRLNRRVDGLCDVEAPAGLSRAILDALPAQPYGPSPLRRALAWGAGPVLALLLVAGGLLVRGRFQLREQVAEREIEVVFTAPQAASVSVVGDFNSWDPQRTRMVRVDHGGSWSAMLKLAPGVHQYSFVIDGKTWMPDPGSKKTIDDGFGGRNSVLIVDG
jgi:anti-sigma factor RsiW